VSLIFRFFVANWRFSFLVTAMAIIMGLLGLGLLQRESFPPVNFATLTVVTFYPGASPEEVQDRVTKPIEDELRGAAGLKDVKSISQTGRSQITIRIDIDRADVENIVNEVQRAVARGATKLPTEVKDAPLVTEIKAREIPVIELALTGDNSGRARDQQAERLKEALEDVRGVSSVRFSGYQERELQILLDREKLAAFGTGITEVVTTLTSRLRNVPAGSIESSTKNSLVRIIGQSGDPKEIEQVVVRSNDGGVIRLSQVGMVLEGAKKPEVLARLNGEPATLMVVTKNEEIDAISVVDSVLERIKTFEANQPSRNKIVIYNDEAERVRDRLQIVEFNAIAGLLAVLAILFVFLPGKIGLFSALSLPVCALSTVAMMVAFGANFNVITMIALVICLGNLVDNSVVVSEFYSSLREKGISGPEAATQASRQFWIPFTASTITIVAAFLPMLVTEGVLGQFIRWIPIVVTIALVISLVESLTLLPARLQFLDFKPKKKTEISYFTRVENGFGNVVKWSLKWRYLAALLLGSLVVSGFVVTALFNRFELFPPDGVEYYIARFEAPAQTPIHQTDLGAAKISDLVFKALGPEVVSSIVARSGVQQADFGDPQAKNGEQVGFLLIRIKKEVYPSLNSEKTLGTLREIPKPEIFERLTFETQAGGPPVGQAVTVTFRSSDPIELRREAQEFAEKLAQIEGVRNVATDEVKTGQEYLLKPNDERTAFVGLTNDQLGQNLRAGIEGVPVAELSARGIEYDVVVRYVPSDKNDLQDVVQTRVLNSKGQLTPLKLLGEIREEPAPATIKSFDFRRSITVTADVNTAVITSSQANAKAREILLESMRDTTEVSTIFGGEEESTNESLRSLGIALVLAIFGIFATLVFTFKSFSLPLLVLSTIPLGLVGVLYAFAINQRPLSFLAFIGVVGLSGVVINSAIILVDFIEELRRERPQEDNLAQILVEASRLRLRAVLATGLTTVVGLLPTAFGLGGDDPLLVPITLALSWGMIVGTVLSLIWIPACYLILQDISQFVRNTLLRKSPTR
jgi:multidrug efflux pump subunit AcrB